MAEPQLIQTTSRWLALSPPNARFRIGVVGDDEAQARQRFDRALAAWERLVALPDIQPHAEELGDAQAESERWRQTRP